MSEKVVKKKPSAPSKRTTKQPAKQPSLAASSPTRPSLAATKKPATKQPSLAAKNQPSLAAQPIPAHIQSILSENSRRNEVLFAPFNPITGENSVGARFKFECKDFPIHVQFLPVEMKDSPMVRHLSQCGSVEKFITDKLGEDLSPELFDSVVDTFCRDRYKFDFPFWAATLVYIKRKGGGSDCLFRLTYPQRKFVSMLMDMLHAGTPIRIVMLKARQWGGSTTSQLFMAWLQLIHDVGLNSLIIAHQGTGSDEIKDMFDRMLKNYPVSMLHAINDAYDENEPKLIGVGKSGAIHRVPQRNCKIKVGTAERPDSCRGGDYNLVHLSEVGIWKETEGKKPEDIVRSACSGVLYRPHTMIVYESTANGVGNFFHREYVAARDNPRSQFRSLFVSWFDIEQYYLKVDNLVQFATDIYNNRLGEQAPSNREEPGRYLWYLWTLGATLEGINWYIIERAKYASHGSMAAEYPSDDIEAFVNSGSSVFDMYQVEAFRKGCRDPRHIGDVYGRDDSGPGAIVDVKFKEDSQGQFYVWALPDVPDDGTMVTDRYLVVVDIGGRSDKADYSVIAVFDRFDMMDAERPAIVAQWYGHIDMDRLAWKAAQVATFYDNALLVIESNTLETHERDRIVDGDQSEYILSEIKDVYDNLYAREQSESDIRDGIPKKYGFHTNTATKPTIISDLVKHVREFSYIERDQRCLNEMLVYERKQNGSYGAQLGYHDDLLMTRAIGLFICFKKMPIPQIVKRQDMSRVRSSTRSISAATMP